MPRRLIALLLLGICAVFHGCASVSAERGTENLWRDPTVATWEVGRTTEQDVLSALGPPSQLIALQDETVYYYMLEEARTKIMILILYNQARARVNYDRAMFIFDKQGVLTKYSLSRPPAEFKKK